MSNETLMTSDAEQTNASGPASEPTAQPEATAAPTPVSSNRAPKRQQQKASRKVRRRVTSSLTPTRWTLKFWANTPKWLRSWGFSQDAAQTILDKVLPTIQSRQRGTDAGNQPAMGRPGAYR